MLSYKNGTEYKISIKKGFPKCIPFFFLYLKSDLLRLLTVVCVTFHFFLFAFFAQMIFFVVVMMNMYFHMLSSIAMRDFVTLQVQMLFSHRYLKLIELTKYKCALFCLL